jgi:predicted Kef-type K+ transport protein
LDVAGALIINLILDEVLAVIVVSNFTWNFDTVSGLDVDLEDVTTRFSVFAVIVTGLDDEFNWLTDSLLLEDTWTEAK